MLLACVTAVCTYATQGQFKELQVPEGSPISMLKTPYPLYNLCHCHLQSVEEVK
jgi:hypothetical protein